MERDFLWIDSDAGIDDAVAIMFAMRYSNLLGVSCTYGNTICANVIKNVGRIFDIMHNQFPEMSIPALTVSCEVVPNASSVKHGDENIYCHGVDGLGDVPEFDKQHKIQQGNYPLLDFLPAVQEAARTAQSYGKKLKFLAIGSFSSLVLVQGIENIEFYAMGGAIPEYAGQTPNKENRGNMGDFKCPMCEHNIGCDLDSAEEAFDKLEITLADWAISLAYPIDASAIIDEKSNVVGKFFKAIHHLDYYSDDYCVEVEICDLLTVFVAIFGDKCKCNDCNVEVIKDGSVQHGRTVGHPGNKCHVLCYLDIEFLHMKLHELFY